MKNPFTFIRKKLTVIIFRLCLDGIKEKFTAEFTCCIRNYPPICRIVPVKIV